MPISNKRLNALARRYTGINTFSELCAMHHNPTIRGNSRAGLLVSAFNRYQAEDGREYRAAHYYEAEDLKAQAAALNWPI